MGTRSWWLLVVESSEFTEVVLVVGLGNRFDEWVALVEFSFENRGSLLRRPERLRAIAGNALILQAISITETMVSRRDFASIT